MMFVIYLLVTTLRNYHYFYLEKFSLRSKICFFKGLINTSRGTKFKGLNNQSFLTCVTHLVLHLVIVP